MFALGLLELSSAAVAVSTVGRSWTAGALASGDLVACDRLRIEQLCTRSNARQPDFDVRQNFQVGLSWDLPMSSISDRGHICSGIGGWIVVS